MDRVYDGHERMIMVQECLSVTYTDRPCVPGVRRLSVPGVHIHTQITIRNISRVMKALNPYKALDREHLVVRAQETCCYPLLTTRDSERTSR